MAPTLREWRMWALLVAVLAVALPLLADAAVTVRLPAFDRISLAVTVGLTVALAFLPLVLAGGRSPGGADVSTALVFAILLHWGVAPALLVRAIGVVAFAAVQRWSWWRTAFNLGQYTVSWAAAAFVLELAGRHPDATIPVPLSGGELGAVLAAAVTYLIVNTLAVTVMIAAHRHQRLVRVLARETPQKLLVNSSLLALAPLVVLAVERSAWLVLLVLVPLLAVREVAALSARQERAAQHDALTGLPNRLLFAARTRDALGDVAGGTGSAAVLLLDLDRFKEINDALGHPAGDELLKRVADRLVDAAGPGATVGRLSGDEFAVLVPGLPSADATSAAENVARRLTAALALPVALHGVPIGVTASIGIAPCPAHGNDPDSLLARADAAMYTAKGGGPVAYAFCRPDTDRSSVDRLALLEELRRAIAGDEAAGRLVLHYQPQVALADAAVVGAEALVRWHHPTRGLLVPGDFLPMVGHGALLHQLTRRVVDIALAQRRTWAERGLTLPLAVNVSAEDLADPHFAAWLAKRLDAHGVDANGLTLEITETALMVDASRTVPILRALNALGVALSLDDFGTGYASLTHLRMLPVHELKIDRSFVAGMRSEPDDETLVKSVVELGAALGLRVVAEGVEDEATRVALLLLGGADAQGNHFCPPLAADEFWAWAAHRPKAPRSTAALLPRA